MRVKTSKYKGVKKSRNKWRCYLTKGGNIIAKTFDTEIEAAEFYNLHSKKPNELAKRLICTICEIEKDKTEFYLDKRKSTIVTSICKDCQSIQTTIDSKFRRLALSRNERTIEYLKIDRVLKLIEKGVITKDEGRELYNRHSSIKCAFAIKLKKQKNIITRNSV